jgi:hypothetical protein
MLRSRLMLVSACRLVLVSYCECLQAGVILTVCRYGDEKYETTVI